MQVKTRTVKAPDERRNELIAAAQQLFYTKGYESTSVSDIVKTVGVAKGTFYYYFDSKVDILEALVDSLTEQSLVVMDAIVMDESLSALEKWRLAFQTTGAWKTEHKTELLIVLRVMHSPDNVLLRHKVEKAVGDVAAPEIAKIIRQGVAEGVFETEFVEESAEIAFNVMRSISDFLADLILNPENYENHFVLAQRKVNAIQYAVERVLGAPEGSLRLLNDDTLAVWFQ